jgi:eukaryotic-like serine/threonine-protein kinase
MKEPLSIVGTTISHYRIIQKLGAGGMGEVYLAQDSSLGRKVAIKILPDRLAADEEARRRLIGEARAAAKVDHPNICTIHEVGEEEGRAFIVMQYVAGETLGTMIHRKRLGLTESLDIALQIAEGLAEAHSLGMIHRDLKPENVMITAQGRVKVMDFGLAKATQDSPLMDTQGLTVSLLTEPGIIVGTPAYMSPEQVRGEALDTRSDIFSFGAVLYELITGKQPFAAENAIATISAVLTREAPPLKQFGVDSPVALQKIVARALDKDLKNRYQTVAELLRDLRSLATAQRQLEGAENTAPSIVVLPFLNISADPENEYFCDGLAEELISTLTKIERLRVVARTSAFAFKGKDDDIREIGSKLNVNTVLQGSVRKAVNRLRITAQLINVSDGYHLWSERYDREIEDVFALQDELSFAIVSALKVKLLGEEKQALLNRYRDNLDAYNLYLKGRYFWGKRPSSGDIEKGIEYFQRAIETDPGYALAYAGLADSYAILGSWENGTYPPHEAMPKAKAAAQKALELDDQLAEAHASLAFVNLHYDWDWRRAEAGCKRAIESNPNYVVAHHWYSHQLMATGRIEESLAESEKCLELDPLDQIINTHLAWHYHSSRQYDQAIEQCDRTFEIAPGSFWLSYFLALAQEQKGLYDDAISNFQGAATLSGNVTFAAAALGHAYGVAGRKSEARSVLNELIRQSEQRFVPSYDIAIVHTGLGEKDQAFEWLQKAYEERTGWMAYLKVEPRLDSLRDDQRFTDLLVRVGFAR